MICTTQVPLQHYVEDGKMRGDLFHRLNVLRLDIPPLRERKEDIEPLTRLFVQQISDELSIVTPHFDQNFIAYLCNYPWPGNVRELYNALYRACSLVDDGKLSVNGLSLVEKDILPTSIEQFANQTLDQIMSSFESMILQKFYEQYPSTRKLAYRLGVSHTAIANKLKQYGINK